MGKVGLKRAEFANPLLATSTISELAGGLLLPGSLLLNKDKTKIGLDGKFGQLHLLYKFAV